MAYRILIVDDSTVTRMVLKKTIGMTNVPVREIFEAGNGYEALDSLNHHSVDLIMADINMPEMNGMEMIEEMRRDGLLETVPVVIISTEGSRTRIEELQSKGVRAYLRKPFTPEALKRVIEEILESENEEK